MAAIGGVMLPLLEIDDEEQKIELTKELLDFVAKAFAVHNRRLDAEAVNQAFYLKRYGNPFYWVSSRF